MRDGHPLRSLLPARVHPEEGSTLWAEQPFVQVTRVPVSAGGGNVEVLELRPSDFARVLATIALAQR